jgi:hypothetical protein
MPVTRLKLHARCSSTTQQSFNLELYMHPIDPPITIDRYVTYTVTYMRTLRVVMVSFVAHTADIGRLI